ncbi:MAG: DEAD/DEAH box helicase [Thioalkalivibrionaceae bacterium]
MEIVAASDPHDALGAFTAATQAWFRANFARPTRIQQMGWPAIHTGAHTLLIAPTGSGKTLAAFLVAIDRLLRGRPRDGELAPQAATHAEPTKTHRAKPRAATTSDKSEKPQRRGWRIVYISPLKALAADVERNLRAPLVGIAHHALRRGEPAPEIRIDLRTGDTPTRERARQARDPGDILITTPESLYLLLASKAADLLRDIDTLIIDEVHAVAGSKRGAHLALSCERLASIQPDATTDRPQRIGLSATVEPPSAAARWLGGDRDVTICDAAEPPHLDLAVLLPEELDEIDDVRDPADPTGAGGGWPNPVPATSAAPAITAGSILGQLYADAVSGAPRANRDRAAALERHLLPLILSHRSSIVFVNSRGLCERLVQRLNTAHAETLAAQEPSGDDAPTGQGIDPDILEESSATDTVHTPPRPPELCAAHHGSVSHARRAELEERLKSGAIRALVATSSLELGVDMGAVDLVILVESPGAVSRGLQRAGRAGHGVDQTSIARIVPRHRYELLECAVLGAEMLAGRIEPLVIPRAPLDVLAQQIVAIVCAAPDGEPTPVKDVERLIRRAAPFTDLADAALHAVLDLLSGHYPSTELAHLRPWLAYDRAEQTLTPRRGARLAVRLNAGTIPDRGQYRVQLGDSGTRIGELDEEMVHELRPGEILTLGASSWRVEDITHDAVHVSPAPGLTGKLPFWRGDGPGRPLALGQLMLELNAALEPLSDSDRLRYLLAETPLSPPAARELTRLIDEQIQAAGVLPGPRRIVIERFRDELGDWRVCIHAPFGTPVLTPWALALQHRLAEDTGFNVQVLYTDDGIMLRLTDGDATPELETLLPDAAELERIVTEQLAQSSVFAARFRENAARALLLARNRPDRRTPLWAQRIQSAQLLAAVQRYPTFPIVLETYRELLADVFDLNGLRQILDDIQRGSIDIIEVETPRASPLARSLAFAFVSAYVYEGDAPLAERRAQALTLDRELLAELIGHADLRELLDLGVIEHLERELRGETPNSVPRSVDELHDWLRRLGDRRTDEIVALALAIAQTDAETDGPDIEATDGPTTRPDETDSQPTPSAQTVAHARATLDTWLAQLRDSRRAAVVRIAGEPRWIAADDAGLYRDALGLAPPAGLPDRFLERRESPLEQLLARYAATHGPFEAQAFAQRYDLPIALVDQAAQALVRSGRLTRGALRPGGQGIELCHIEILRRIKRRTLASARQEVAAVDGATYQRFLLEWQGLADSHDRPRIEDVLLQLEGHAAPWSLWRDVILPSRLANFRLDTLELLIARGEWQWLGANPAGPRDARVRFLRREALALMPADAPSHDRTPSASDNARDERLLLDILERRGTAYYMDLVEAWRDASADIQNAHRRSEGDSKAASNERRNTVPLTELDDVLARLLWTGRVINDTLGPLRSLGQSKTANGKRSIAGRPTARAWRSIGQTRQPIGGSPPDVNAANTATWLNDERPDRDAISPFGPSLRLGRSTRRRQQGTRGLAGGRYTSLTTEIQRGLRELARDDAERTSVDTERALLLVDQWLERYGFISRATVQAEGFDGGFGALYPVLKQLEEQGHLRRGHFIEGLDGIQFARRHAIDRLRSLERPADGLLAENDHRPRAKSGGAHSRSRHDTESSTGLIAGRSSPVTANAGAWSPPHWSEEASAPPVHWLAALDPAQPWGRLLRWPDRSASNACANDDTAQSTSATNDPTSTQERSNGGRSASARLIVGGWLGLFDGHPVLFVSVPGKRFEVIADKRPNGQPLTDVDWIALWQSFASTVGAVGPRRGIAIERVDQQPLLETAWTQRLRDAGAESTPSGVLFAHNHPPTGRARRRV